MDRREALSVVSILLGGVVVGSEAFLNGCRPARRKPLKGLLNINEIELMNDMGEAIMPKTESSPGAKDVQIGNFINSIASDCYNPREQAVFMEGIIKLNELSKTRFGKIFSDLSEESRTVLLNLLENESRLYKMSNGLPHYYQMIKQLVIWGYLSSMQVSVQVLGYVLVPGRYEGCVPFREGDKAIL